VQAFRRPDGTYPEGIVQTAFELSHDQASGVRHTKADDLFASIQNDPVAQDRLINHLASYGRTPLHFSLKDNEAEYEQSAPGQPAVQIAAGPPKAPKLTLNKDLIVNGSAAPVFTDESGTIYLGPNQPIPPGARVTVKGPERAPQYHVINTRDAAGNPVQQVIELRPGATYPAAGAEDVGVGSDVRTTSTGRPYVDLSKYKGKDYSTAQQQAHALGAFGANAGETDALANIETARQNFNTIEQSLAKLPTGPGGRVLEGPLNRLQAWAQTDADLASWGTYRSAAIQAMRAMAGSKGLRINKSEIETSMANDIPEITDTQATARNKLARVRKMLDNQETGIMGPGATPPRHEGDPLGILGADQSRRDPLGILGGK
jgi:hypothetical protein